jgi:hypothetical protein
MMKIKTPFQLTIIFVALLALSSCQQSPSGREITPRFSHHVFFWLNNPDNPNDRAAFEKGIAELLEIPEIKAYHFGTPAHTGDRGVVDASYTYSFLVFYDDEAGHDIYQDHPLHLKFIDDCKHLWSKVLVYDSVSK